MFHLSNEYKTCSAARFTVRDEPTSFASTFSTENGTQCCNNAAGFSGKPITFEYSGDETRFRHNSRGPITGYSPTSVTTNHEVVHHHKYKSTYKTLSQTS